MNKNLSFLLVIYPLSVLSAGLKHRTSEGRGQVFPLQHHLLSETYKALLVCLPFLCVISPSQMGFITPINKWGNSDWKTGSNMVVVEGDF